MSIFTENAKSVLYSDLDKELFDSDWIIESYKSSDPKYVILDTFDSYVNTGLFLTQNEENLIDQERARLKQSRAPK